MASFKEIVTKAIVGKAKKTSNDSFSLKPEENPDTVLGCWVINHTFSGSKGNNGYVNINGEFDVNVWYSYDNDKKTAVSSKRFSYVDKMNVPLKEVDSWDSSNEIMVRCLHQPTVANVNVDNGEVKMDISKEMGVEIVGDAKVKISVEDENDDYDEVMDEEDIDNISDDYLENKDE